MRAVIRVKIFLVLDNIGIVRRIDHGNQITFLFGDETRTVKTCIDIATEGEIIILSTPEFFIPLECRNVAMQYLNERNLKSRIGCLQLDTNTGKVEYRTSVRYGSSTSIEGVLANFIAMHQNYFASNVYPSLVMLKDITTVPIIEKWLLEAWKQKP